MPVVGTPVEILRYTQDDAQKETERNLEFGPSPDASKTMRRPLPAMERLLGHGHSGPSASQTPLGMTQKIEEALLKRVRQESTLEDERRGSGILRFAQE